ncbi:alanine racemase [Collinsella tanakaei]|uniref:Alanine racemase n=1 Tax=Collinsella tanakaei YIT 12063 TaxID=742742 RepID=G1WI69_9ACTN|nr:alanine racemase [Collinsella tanakaei]EGX71644.1 alanine racemase [Collinsella tanakaei YIT 12063]
MPSSKEPATRWAWVEIDQGALRRNTRAFKNLLGYGKRLCCVVKADAYGHGAVQCAKIMHATGADMFAVATVSEGVQLREGGIKSPILVLNEPPIDACDTLLEYQIMPSVYSSEFALAYGERAVEMGCVGKYHMAIETGMNRIGVRFTDVLEFRREIDFHRGIECDGVFTHFATADDPDGWDYRLQCTRFSEAVAAMKDAGFECGIVHCSNTPASMLDHSMQFDMIRAGIGLYGLQPCEKSAPIMPLEPVMSVRARVTRTIHPAMGEGVGYGFTFRVPRARVQVCTIPVGYADGLPRTLSNKMDVLYRGQRIRQVGNICMDQCMVAIQQTPARQMPEAEVGDLITIVGKDGDAVISMDEMARLRGTINYEVACGFGMRLEKVYI